jgi:hypothetical protein
VFGSHWREIRFWKWWLQYRAPMELRVGGALLLLSALLVGGWFAASRLSPAGAVSSAYTLETTLTKTVTVRQNGKLVRRAVRVVKRVRLRPETVFRTDTSFGTKFVTTPGGVRIVRQRVVKYVPRVRTHVVTVGGKTRTITETQQVPTTTVETRTETNVVTGATRTVTETQSQTDVITTERTVVNQQTVTETQTRTVTVTETVPVTFTDTVTVIAGVTVTITVPGGP